MNRPLTFGCLALGVCTVAAWSAQTRPPSAAGQLLARAAGQELSVARVARLLGVSRIPAVPASVATTVDLWVSYHLLAHAGARGENLALDDPMADDAMWYDLHKLNTEAFYERVRASFPEPDAARIAQQYAAGAMLAAQHILFAVPNGATPRVQDSVRLVAEGVLRRTTAANFAALARQYSSDATANDDGGSLGIFPRGPAQGAMVPEFEAAVLAVQPGQIAAQLVRTGHGYHIVRRHALAEVRSRFVEHLRGLEAGRHRDAYIARLRAQYGVRFLPGAMDRIRALAASPALAVAESDTTTLATSTMGAFTVGRLAEWIEAVARERPLAAALAAANDSTVVRLVGALIEQEMFAEEARKAGFGPDTAALRTTRGSFATMVNIAAERLGLSVAALHARGGTVAERERYAARQVEDALDRIFATGGDGYAEIAGQLARGLRRRYGSSVNPDAFEAAAERTVAMRMARDSLAVPARR